MRRTLRIAGWVCAGLVVLVAIGITATIGWRPFLGPKSRELTARRFESSPERLARGQYLVDGVLGCFGCHSEREWDKHDVPLLPGMEGGGAATFPIQDLPGDVHPPNISPDKETGAGNWTDDQFARAIREGIGNDGRALFPFMPYPYFRYLSDEDLASVIVYVRSVPPVRHVVPKTELIFPVKYLIRSVPEPLTQPVPPPDLSTDVKRGDYLVRVAGCRDCHTPQKNGASIAGLDLGGGFPIRGPWGEAASANLTPDPSGIPYYDEALFREAFRTGFVKARQLKQIMPWWGFRSMNDGDLNAVFAYLRSVPPVKHRVDNAKPPTACRVCGLSHGGGDLN